MAVVHVVVCVRCGAQHWAGRARSDWSARARAAAHRWVTEEHHGITDDVCPACVTASVPVVQAAARAAVAEATEVVRTASAVPAGRGGHPELFEAGLDLCHWCGEGMHAACTGCECLVCS